MAPAAPLAAPAPPAWPPLDDALVEAQTATLNFTLGAPGHVWVAPDGAAVLFTRSGPRSFEADLYALTVATGAVDRVLSAAELLAGGGEELSAEERARRERMRQVTRGITGFTASEDGKRFLVPLSGRLFLHDRARGRTRELPVAGAALDPRLSPDGRRVAYVADGDLFVLDAATARSRRLTRRRSDAIEHGLAEYVAQEELGRMRGHWWSPDGKRLAYQRTDAGPVDTLWVADATRPEQAPVAFRYPRAGTANAVVELGVVAAGGGRTVWLRWDRERYPYVGAVRWQKKAPLTVAVLDRAQQELVLLAADPDTGATRALLREADPAWVNVDPSVPCWLPDGKAFLWSTERGGAWQLELRDRRGDHLRALTPPELGYQRLAGVDAAGEHAFVLASGDPRQTHVYRVPLAGGAPARLSRGDGRHDIVTGRRTGTHVLVSTDAGGATRWSVRAARGEELGALPSAAEEPPFAPALELAAVEVDGRTHHAAVVRPRAFDPALRYPVLLNVYGGPHVTTVGIDPRAYLLDQWYADAGFIVVRADGRGTPHRGRDWERAIRGAITAAPLDDQVAVLQALGRDRPEMDLDRAGVYGWSFGGTMAVLAVLLRPDVFRAAVAGAPVTDWRDYDTCYTERYLGLPADNPDGYRACSPLSHADRLERPLLLVHGTTDDNVYFSHSLRLAQALFRAGRRFDMLPLAGFTHMVPDPAVKKALVRRIVDFFRAHLSPPR